MLKDAVTLPQALQRGGYRTLGVGKIFHDNLLAAELAREFEVWGEVEHYKSTPARKFACSAVSSRSNWALTRIVTWSWKLDPDISKAPL